jgi:plasmid stabilization system protein ParE
MTDIEYSRNALDNITHLVDFLMEVDVLAASTTFEVIDDGIMLLKRHPEIGHPITNTNMRELVISRGKTGYVAIYEFIEALDTVLILAIRHQREAGLQPF